MTSVGTTRKLGSASPIVFPLALGCMVTSGLYGRSKGTKASRQFTLRSTKVSPYGHRRLSTAGAATKC
jgi:hypothetical protein